MIHRIKDNPPPLNKPVLFWERWSSVPFIGRMGKYGVQVDVQYIDCAGDGYLEDSVCQSLVRFWAELPEGPHDEDYE